MRHSPAWKGVPQPPALSTAGECPPERETMRDWLIREFWDFVYLAVFLWICYLIVRVFVDILRRLF